MTRDEAMLFAQRWIENWNRKDVEGVLSHFADDTRFTSPTAATLMGTPAVEGKAALRRYWETAVSRIERIYFTLDYALWDADRQELCVVYIADLDGRRKRACELMRFDASDRQVAGEALYGVDVQSA
jgi:ketosteroid isomerase-like protein